MALRYRMTPFAQPPEADNADSDCEQHDEANECDANAHVPRNAGHHEVRNGEKDVRQHLGKAPLSLGPQPSASRAASANSQKPRRGLTISGPMSRGGGEAKSPNQGHAIAGPAFGSPGPLFDVHAGAIDPSRRLLFGIAVNLIARCPQAGDPVAIKVTFPR